MAVVATTDRGFSFGHFVLLSDRLLELVEESRMQRVVNDQSSTEIEQLRLKQTDLICKSVERDGEREDKGSSQTDEEYTELLKKVHALSAENQQMTLKASILSEENTNLKDELFASNKEKIISGSKVIELEAKMAVHFSGKESCLAKLEEIQNKFASLNKNYANLSSNLTTVQNNFKQAKVVQTKLRFLNHHHECIIHKLEKEILIKNTTIVKLKVNADKAKRSSPATAVAPNYTFSDQEKDAERITSLKNQLVESSTEVKRLLDIIRTNKVSLVELTKVFSADRLQFNETVEVLQSEVVKFTHNANDAMKSLIEKQGALENKESLLNKSVEELSELQSEFSVLKGMIIESKESVEKCTGTDIINRSDFSCQIDSEEKRIHYNNQPTQTSPLVLQTLNETGPTVDSNESYTTIPTVESPELSPGKRPPNFSLQPSKRKLLDLPDIDAYSFTESTSISTPMTEMNNIEELRVIPSSPILQAPDGYTTPENRKSVGYLNDPDYSPIDSPQFVAVDEDAVTTGVVEGAEIALQTAVSSDMTTHLPADITPRIVREPPDRTETVFLSYETEPQIAGASELERYPFSIIVSSSSSDEDETSKTRAIEPRPSIHEIGAAQSLSPNQTRSVVIRIVNSSFKEVDKVLGNSPKVTLFKASLGKSPCRSTRTKSPPTACHVTTAEDHQDGISLTQIVKKAKTLLRE